MSKAKVISTKTTDTTRDCLALYFQALSTKQCTWNHLYKECPRLDSTRKQAENYHTDIIADWLCPTEKISNNKIFSDLITHIDKINRNNYFPTGKCRKPARPPRNHETINNYERYIEKYILQDYSSSQLPVTLYDESFSKIHPRRKIGPIVQIEVPLESEDGNKRNLGAIDIVAQSASGLYLCELKRALSEEGILRSLMEIFTYAMTIADTPKFCRQMKATGKDIVLCPLFFKGSQTYYDFLRLKALPRPAPIHRLISCMRQCGFCINFAVIDPQHMSPGIIEWIKAERRAFIKAKYPCIANCEQCGLCAMFHGHDAETAFADYIDGKRSFEDVLKEYKR